MGTELTSAGTFAAHGSDRRSLTCSVGKLLLDQSIPCTLLVLIPDFIGRQHRKVKLSFDQRSAQWPVSVTAVVGPPKTKSSSQSVAEVRSNRATSTEFPIEMKVGGPSAAWCPEQPFAGQPERRRGIEVALRFMACPLAPLAPHVRPLEGARLLC